MMEKMKWTTLKRTLTPKCDGAQNRAPEEIALMHLREEREHQQPGSDDGDEEPGIPGAGVPGRAKGAEGEGAEINKAQRPLQSDDEVERPELKRPDGCLEREIPVRKERGKVVGGTDEEIRITLAPVEEPDLQPGKTPVANGADRESGDAGQPRGPGQGIARAPLPQKSRDGDSDSRPIPAHAAGVCRIQGETKNAAVAVKPARTRPARAQRFCQSGQKIKNGATKSS